MLGPIRERSTSALTRATTWSSGEPPGTASSTGPGGGQSPGGQGRDFISSGEGNDEVSAGSGWNDIRADEGDDIVVGGLIRDFIRGGPRGGHPLRTRREGRLEDGDGSEIVIAGAGNDSFGLHDSGRGNEFVGGPGRDADRPPVGRGSHPERFARPHARPCGVAPVDRIGLHLS